MREYCLVTTNGDVVNMSMSYKPTAPEVTDFQRERGYKWVPVSKVPVSKLQQYQYWNERP